MPTSPNAAAPTTGTQAVDRALDLLARVVQAGEPVSFTELSDRTGLARSTTSRLLSALERGGFVVRDGEGTFVPGVLFEMYAASRDGDALLIQTCHPELVALGEETGETIHLAVARADTVVHLDQVDSTYFLGSRDWIGVEVPPHTSALGKVLYAWDALTLPAGELEAPTPQSIASVADLARELPGIRRRGWAQTVDELELGLTGLAAPVLVDGVIVAAIGLSGPTSRLADQISTTGAVVAAHARALSTRLRRTGIGAASRPKEGAA
ncbi:MAG: IclR family transcriptional regulator [Phycicoccus sp.]|nr:IclR family transcriptional regulator [Phycicoccus sp.]